MDYRDRLGNEYSLETSQDKFLRYLYGSKSGRLLARLLARPFITRAMGSFFSSRVSCLLIDSFLKSNNISLKDYVATRYKSYNECFTRKIKPGKRPFSYEPEILCSPSDGKVSAYVIDEDLRFNIKGCEYSVASLLRDEALAQTFEGGYCVIIRLSVDNYHRYAYIDNGSKSDNIHIQGIYHTVNPSATSRLAVYHENTREYTIIESDHFGRFIQMEVGAMGVGRICNYDQAGQVRRGSEKGKFEFGGSTIVLLFEKDRLSLDEDLLTNTAEGFETTVLMGEHLGRQ